MVYLKSIVIALFATTAVATPAGLLDARTGTVSCKYKDESGKSQSVTFTTSTAQALAKKAPAGSPATTSGYPHIFQNLGTPLVWPNAQCNSAKVTTLEYPINVAKSAQATLYDYTKKKDVNKPGPCRIVYAQVGGAFCGIMCHESMVENDDNRDFLLCA